MTGAAEIDIGHLIGSSATSCNPITVIVYPILFLSVRHLTQQRLVITRESIVTTVSIRPHALHSIFEESAAGKHRPRFDMSHFDLISLFGWKT